MRYSGLMLLLVALTASAQESQVAPAHVVMIAIKASDEEPAFFDPSLDAVRGALSDIKLNSFRELQSARADLPYGSETALEISKRYTLYVLPQSKSDDGRVRAKVRITLAPRAGGAKPVDAVNTTVLMAPGKYVKIRGLKLEGGELVVLLTVSK